jgi:hypothetical protein
MELKTTDLILKEARSAVSKDGRGLGLACGGLRDARKSALLRTRSIEASI